MQLPAEVSDAVIDQASDNTTSLRHLSLTCTKFLPRSRYHLFTSIAIRTAKQMESSRDFLDAHPWLLPLVHKVTLDVTGSKDGRKNGENDISKRDAHLCNVVPVHLLNRLPNLHVWKMEATFELHPSKTSFHPFALRCYRIYGSHVHHLELSHITFNWMPDLTQLVWAFTSLHTLTCSSMSFRHKVAETDFSQGANIPARSLQLSGLQVDTDTDMCAIEYLMAYGGATLSDIRLDALFESRNYFKPLERSMRSLSRLSSLTLVMHVYEYVLGHYGRLSRWLRRGAWILGSVHPLNVRVEFKADPIAKLASCLSYPVVLEACKVLEEVLLTLPDSRVVVHGTILVRRSGRAELWESIIGRAFPRLNERGRLRFEFTHDTQDQLGHECRVTSLVVSHDSKRIVTASLDGTIIIWDTSSGTLLDEWSASECGDYCVDSLALSPDSRRLLSAGGRAPFVWAIDNDIHHQVTELEGPKGNSCACAWSPDGALIAFGSKYWVCVWDSDTFQQRDLIINDLLSYRPCRMHFSPDSRHLAWISDGPDCCCIWRPFMGEPPQQLPSHPNRSDVRTVALSFDPETRRIATANGYTSGDLDIWVARTCDATGAELAVRSGHAGGVTNISFSPDGRSLLSTSAHAESAGSAWVWDTESWEHTCSLEVAQSSIAQACFSPNGEYLATATWGTGQKLRLWRTDDYSCVAEFSEHGDAVLEHVTFTPNGEFLVYTDANGMVHSRSLSNFIGH